MMKARHIIVLVLVAGAIALFWLRPGPQPKTEVEQSPVQEVKTNAPEPPRAMIEKTQLLPEETNITNDILAGAYEMAAFVDRIYDSVPKDNFSTRNHLKGIQAIFFISDYVMIAKTNSSLAVSKSAIADAFAKFSSDTSVVREQLNSWAVRRPGTLADHYRGISEVPTEKENIKAIKTVLTENGVPIDTESDLLMDCIRYAAHNTDIQEMYGPVPKNTVPTPDPAAVKSLVSTGDEVFRHRFAEKYGLDPHVITNLMERIKTLRIYGLSPADVQIPVSHF